MNYWIRLVKGPVSIQDHFFENTPQDWTRLREALDFGYTISSVEPVRK